MNPLTLIMIAGLIAVHINLHAADAPRMEPNGSVCLRLENPVQKEDPIWVPLHLDIALKDGRPAAAMAFATRLNNAGHPIDVSRLILTDGRLKGEVTVAFGWDDAQRQAESFAKAKSSEKKVTPKWADGVAQVLAADCPVTDLIGPASGTVSWQAQTAPSAGRWGSFPPAPGPMRPWKPANP